MRSSPKSLMRFVLAGTCAIATACTTAQPTNSNQRNDNTSTSPSNVSPSNSSATRPPQQSNPVTTGSIEVASIPAGARVLLVSTGAEGAGQPQTKGVTPTTITGLEPGKYTVDLEKPGYRFFQKEVEVRPGQTIKVSTNLKKQ
jgi:PEGA domain-containing protein